MSRLDLSLLNFENHLRINLIFKMSHFTKNVKNRIEAKGSFNPQALAQVFIKSGLVNSSHFIRPIFLSSALITRINLHVFPESVQFIPITRLNVNFNNKKKLGPFRINFLGRNSILKDKMKFFRLFYYFFGLN